MVSSNSRIRTSDNKGGIICLCRSIKMFSFDSKTVTSDNEVGIIVVCLLTESPDLRPYFFVMKHCRLTCAHYEQEGQNSIGKV